ncbi:hypothetical protein KHO57_gp105 [Mycobacterium phage Phabba]|uniref:Uncharacterized protein n=1 Tax=Mycobacterium phage Phabba TaxID=2027899 RepID=A0A249XST4_9CAUD|nr:hypothetical protein KHO57_gp105 [Mycobacterium phage Phabba]ASZ74799.1 hypothetical protein SEA_PHABBA_262 [Mycobacterium phage Phabba]
MLPHPERRKRVVTTQKRHSTKLHPQKTNSRCRKTGKVKWYTELDALMAICNTSNKQGSNTVRDSTTKKEIRAYQCPDCDYWHTTHLKEFIPRDQPKPEPKRDLDALRRVAAASGLAKPPPDPEPVPAETPSPYGELSTNEIRRRIEAVCDRDPQELAGEGLHREAD